MDLENFLKTGTLVQIEFKTSSQKKIELNTIVDCPLNDNIFSVYAPIANGRQFSIPTGKDVTINFLVSVDGKKELVSFGAIILSESEAESDTSKISTLNIQKISDVERSQRRSTFRFDINLNVNYKKIGKHQVNILHETYTNRGIREKYTKSSSTEYLSIESEKKAEDIIFKDLDKNMLTSNISATGLKAMTTEKLYVNDIVVIELPLDKQLFRLVAKVMECSPQQHSMLKYDLRIKYEYIDSKEITKITKSLFTMQSEEIRSLIDKGVYEHHDIVEPKVTNHGPTDFMFNYIKYINRASYLGMTAIFMLLLYSFPRMVWGWEKLLNFTPSSYTWNFPVVANTQIIIIPYVALNCLSVYFSYIRHRKYGESHNEKLQYLPIVNVVLGVILFIVCRLIMN